MCSGMASKCLPPPAAGPPVAPKSVRRTIRRPQRGGLQRGCCRSGTLIQAISAWLILYNHIIDLSRIFLLKYKDHLLLLHEQ